MNSFYYGVFSGVCLKKDRQSSAKGKLLFVVVNELNRDAAFVLVFINGFSCGIFVKESRGFN